MGSAQGLPRSPREHTSPWGRPKGRTCRAPPAAPTATAAAPGQPWPHAQASHTRSPDVFVTVSRDAGFHGHVCTAHTCTRSHARARQRVQGGRGRLPARGSHVPSSGQEGCLGTEQTERGGTLGTGPQSGGRETRGGRVRGSKPSAATPPPGPRGPAVGGVRAALAVPRAPGCRCWEAAFRVTGGGNRGRAGGRDPAFQAAAPCPQPACLVASAPPGRALDRPTRPKPPAPACASATCWQTSTTSPPGT